MVYCSLPGPFTGFTRDKVLRHILGIAAWTPPSKLMAGVGVPDGAGGLLEPSPEDGYARCEIEFIPEPQTDPEDGFTYVLSKYKLVFGPALVDWDAINTLGIFDDDSGELLTTAPLWTNWHVKEDQQLIIKRQEVIAGLTYYLTVGMWHPYLRGQVLKHVYCGITYTPPTIWCALSDSAPGINDTGSTITEPNDSAYHRVQVSGWGNPTPWTLALESYVNPQQSFGTATVDWLNHTPVVPVFVDAGSGGNLLFWGHPSIDQTIFAGQTAILGDSYCGVS